MTPEEAAERAREMVRKYDAKDEDYYEDHVHIDLDNLMLEILTTHGYDEVVEIFKKQHKWYA